MGVAIILYFGVFSARAYFELKSHRPFHKRGTVLALAGELVVIGRQYWTLSCTLLVEFCLANQGKPCYSFLQSREAACRNCDDERDSKTRTWHWGMSMLSCSCLGIVYLYTAGILEKGLEVGKAAMMCDQTVTREAGSLSFRLSVTESSYAWFFSASCAVEDSSDENSCSQAWY